MTEHTAHVSFFIFIYLPIYFRNRTCYMTLAKLKRLILLPHLSSAGTTKVLYSRHSCWVFLLEKSHVQCFGSNPETLYRTGSVRSVTSAVRCLCLKSIPFAFIEYQWTMQYLCLPTWFKWISRCWFPYAFEATVFLGTLHSIPLQSLLSLIRAIWSPVLTNLC